MTKQKQILTILCILFLVALLSGYLNIDTSDKNTDLDTGTFTGSIMSSGLKRTYLIHVPSSFDKTKSMPLVIALHGGGGTGKRMEELTLSGLNTLSEKEGFIVVYPDGIGRHWNDGREELRSRVHRQNIDDVGFISDLIDHLIEEYSIDKKRVYVTGISNGAQMSYRLSCELPEKIAAIAPVSGGMQEKFVTDYPSLRPIPVLIINNLDDPLVPWDGGEIRLGRLRFGTVVSVNSTVEYWVSRNNCFSQPTIFWLPDTDPKDGTKVRIEEYSQGKNGTEVILYVIEGGGHTWPSGYQYLPEYIIGRTSKDIDANEVIWNFFKNHSMK